MVAFIGVDGAGKTSNIDYISQLDFFQKTGIKKLYFGNNNYWIPFLDSALKKFDKTPLLKQFLFIISQFDKQMRVFWAFFLIYNGNIVLADRYFYDQDIYEAHLEPQKKNIIKKWVWEAIKPKMLKKPDITIFLDVSSDVAYSRKQDYSFEKLTRVNQAYKDYMQTVKHAAFIDADQNTQKVRQNIIDLLIRHEKNTAIRDV